jgi:predicted transcriptional regulator YheO
MKEYRKHPIFRDLEISQSGDFLLSGKPLKVKYYENKSGRNLSVVCINRTNYSAPKLLLEAWSENPPEGRVYAIFKDGNKKNLRLDNLKWSSNNLTKEQQFKRDLNLSKINRDQTYSAYFSNKGKNLSKAHIARKLNVSPMSVYRAIKRLERKVEDQ